MSKVISFFFMTSLLFGWGTVKSQVFTNVAANTGVNVQGLSTDFWGSGISFYDFNKDGWDDLSIALENNTQAIFLNDYGVFNPAPFQFSNAGQTKMLLWVDYDNDGDLDVFITTKFGQNHLYENLGNFNFVESTIAAGLNTAFTRNYGASFGDYDKDGFLDLYICRYSSPGLDTTNLDFVNNLYHNNGDGTFTDVTFSSGTSNGANPTFLSVWFDYNNDSWPDLMVINDRDVPSALYENMGDGTFNDVFSSVGMYDQNDYTNYMSATVADYNNDQYLDVFISNTADNITDRPHLFENLGLDSFANVYDQQIVSMHNTTWGGLWMDYDNNGWQDLFVATDFLNNSLPKEDFYFYINQYPQPFQEATNLFMGNKSFSSHAVARGDLDNDGFYDVAVNNDEGDSVNVWNNSGNANNFVKLTLEGTISNKMAIGSWIHVYVDGEQYIQYTMCGENFLGQNSQHHIFGIGQHSFVDSIHVIYLSGITDKYYNVGSNQHYNLVEGETNLILSIDTVGSIPFCEGDSVVLSAANMQEYLWNTGDTTASLIVKDAGAYYLSAMDSNGMTHYSTTLNVDKIELPSINQHVESISCFGAEDGEINLQVLNEDYEYQISWSNNTVGDSIIDLDAGSYTFTYEDEYGCVLIDSVELESPFPINVQIEVTPANEDSLGFIQFLLNGGTPPMNLTLDGLTIFNNQLALDSGTYILSVVDDNGCEYTEDLHVGYYDSVVTTGFITMDRLDILVHPNPYLSVVNLMFMEGTASELIIKLFDTTGRVILTKTVNTTIGTNNIALEVPSELATGVVILQIEREGKTYSTTLLKKY